MKGGIFIGDPRAELGRRIVERCIGTELAPSVAARTAYAAGLAAGVADRHAAVVILKALLVLAGGDVSDLEHST